MTENVRNKGRSDDSFTPIPTGIDPNRLFVELGTIRDDLRFMRPLISDMNSSLSSLTSLRVEDRKQFEDLKRIVDDHHAVPHPCRQEEQISNVQMRMDKFNAAKSQFMYWIAGIVIACIVGIIGWYGILMTTKVQVETLREGQQNLSSRIDNMNGTISSAGSKAEVAVTKAELAVTKAELATTKAEAAVDRASKSSAQLSNKIDEMSR